MDFLAIVIPIWIVMAILGAFVAIQKHRAPSEGFFMGLLFGPLGVLIEALLPTEKDQGTPAVDEANRPVHRKLGLDDEGKIAYLSTRYRELLDESETDWQGQTYHRKKLLMRQFDKQLMKELKLTPSQFDELSVEAKRKILTP